MQGSIFTGSEDEDMNIFENHLCAHCKHLKDLGK